MIVCEPVQGSALVVLAVVLPTAPLWLVLVLVGVRAVAGQVFAPASRAAVPALVADRDLESANSTSSLLTTPRAAMVSLSAGFGSR